MVQTIMAQVSTTHQNKHIQKKNKKPEKQKEHLRKQTFLGAIHLCKEDRASFADFRTIPTLIVLAKLVPLSTQRKTII